MAESRAPVRRRWLKWLLAFALVLTLGPVALASLARTRVVREYAGREAAAALRRELGLSAHIDEVDVDPRRLTVVARDIALVHPVHGQFVRAAQLSIRPSWWALLRGRLDLHAIRIERATVWLKIRDGKLINLPVLRASSAPSSTELELPFNILHIEQARVLVDADPDATGELRNIEIDVRSTSGALVRVEVSAAGGFVRHSAGRDGLSKLRLVASVDKQRVSIDELELATPDVQLAVHDADVGLPFGSRYRGKVELGLFVPQLLRWPLGLSLPLDGQLHARADVEGDRQGVRGEGKILLERAVIDQYGLGERVELDVRFDPQRVSFDGVAELIRDGGAVDLSGQLQLAKGLPLKVDARVREVGFAKLMEQLGVSANAIVDWTLAGEFTLAGTLDPLNLSGPLRMPTRDFKVLRHAWHAPVPERRILGVQSAKLAGQVLVRNEGIHLQDIDIELPGSRLNVTVLLGFDNALRLHAKGFDWALADCSPLLQFPLGGRGGFDLEIAGTFSDPVIRGQVHVAEFAFAEFGFGDLTTGFEVDTDLMGVHFTRMDAKKNDSRYALEDGFLDFRHDGFRTGGTLLLEQLAFADFYRIFNYVGDERYEPYQGTVAGKATLDYTLDYPGDSPNGTLITDLELAIPEVVLDGYAFRSGRFSGRFKWLDHALGYRGGELTVERLTLHKGGGTLNVSGRMAREGALDFVVLGDAIAVRETEGLRDRLPGLHGTLGVTGTVKGTAARPRADLDVVASDLSLLGKRLGDARAYVKLTDKEDPWVGDALRWNQGAPPPDAPCGHAREGLARGRWPEDPPLKTVDGPERRLDQPMAWLVCGQALDGQLTADLAIGRTIVHPVRGRIGLAALALDSLLPRGTRGPLHGQLSGTLSFSDGALLEPQSLAGALELTTLRAGQLDVELVNQGPLRLRFDHGAFEVQSATLVGAASKLEITGGGSFAKGLALSFDGSVDLGLLTSLSQTITEASGNVVLGFKVTGMLHEPSVYGHAVVRDAALKVASFPEAVRDVSGKVTFSARRVLLEGFRARVATGTVAWSGSAELQGQGIGSYQLQIEADGLALAPRDGIDLQLGGRGQLAWKRGQALPKLSGRLRLQELSYTRPIKMDRTLGEIYGPERALTTGYVPEDDMLAIDLEIEQQQPIFIRNNLIDAELRLENDKVPFRLVGTDQRFGVTGNMSVRKGFIKFREKNFEIRQGDIRFTDETRVDPTFDLRATTEVRRATGQADWHIQIHAYGSRDQFQFQLSSEPYLTEDDIALLLTVGMTHAELAQLQTSDVTSTAALEALATVTGVESEVHKALPQIDDFHIASTYSERSNRTEPQLVIGKRIADNVRLHASTGVAESRDFSTGVELELDDKTSVQAVYNNQNASTTSQVGDVGVDLKWRLEFD